MTAPSTTLFSSAKSTIPGEVISIVLSKWISEPLINSSSEKLSNLAQLEEK